MNNLTNSPQDYNTRVINHSWGAKEIIQTSKQGNELNVQVFYQSPWQTLKTYISNVFYNLSHPFKTPRNQQHSEKYMGLTSRPLAKRTFTIVTPKLLQDTINKVNRDLAKALEERSFNESKTQELKQILANIETGLTEISEQHIDTPPEQINQQPKPESPKTPQANPKAESPKAEPYIEPRLTPSPTPRSLEVTQEEPQQEPQEEPQQELQVESQATPITPKSVTPEPLSPKSNKPVVTSTPEEPAKDVIALPFVSTPEVQSSFGKVIIKDYDSDEEENLNSSRNSKNDEPSDLAENPSNLLKDQSSSSDDSAVAQANQELVQQNQALVNSEAEVQKLEAAKVNLVTIASANSVGPKALTASTDVKGVEKTPTPELTREAIVEQSDRLRDNLLKARFSESTITQITDWQEDNSELLKNVDISAEDLVDLNKSFNELKTELKSICFKESTAVSSTLLTANEQAQGEPAARILSKTNVLNASTKTAFRSMVAGDIADATLDDLINQKRAINPVVAQESIVKVITSPIKPNRLFFLASSKPATYASAMIETKNSLQSIITEYSKVDRSLNSFKPQLASIREMDEAIKEIKKQISAPRFSVSNAQSAKLSGILDQLTALESTLNVLIKLHNESISTENSNLIPNNLFPDILKPLNLNEFLWTDSTIINNIATQENIWVSSVEDTKKIVAALGAFKVSLDGLNLTVESVKAQLVAENPLLAKLGTSADKVFAKYTAQAASLLANLKLQGLNLKIIETAQSRATALQTELSNLTRTIESVKGDSGLYDRYVGQIRSQIASLNKEGQIQSSQALQSKLDSITIKYQDGPDKAPQTLSELSAQMKADNESLVGILNAGNAKFPDAVPNLKAIYAETAKLESDLKLAEQFLAKFEPIAQQAFNNLSPEDRKYQAAIFRKQIEQTEESIRLYKAKLSEFNNPKDALKNDKSAAAAIPALHRKAIQNCNNILELNRDQMSAYSAYVIATIAGFRAQTLSDGSTNTIDDILNANRYLDSFIQFKTLTEERIRALRNSNPPQIVKANSLQNALNTQLGNLDFSDLARTVASDGIITGLETQLNHAYFSLNPSGHQSLFQQLTYLNYENLNTEDKQEIDRLYSEDVQKQIDSRVDLLQKAQENLKNASHLLTQNDVNRIKADIETKIKSLTSNKTEYATTENQRSFIFFSKAVPTKRDLTTTQLSHAELVAYANSVNRSLGEVDGNENYKADNKDDPLARNKLVELLEAHTKFERRLGRANDFIKSLKEINPGDSERIDAQLAAIKDLVNSRTRPLDDKLAAILLAQIDVKNLIKNNTNKLNQKPLSPLKQFESVGGLNTESGSNLYREALKPANEKLDAYISQLESVMKSNKKLVAENHSSFPKNWRKNVESYLSDELKAAKKLRDDINQLKDLPSELTIAKPAALEVARETAIARFYATQKAELVTAFNTVERVYTRDVNKDSAFTFLDRLTQLDHSLGAFNGVASQLKDNNGLSETQQAQFAPIFEHVMALKELTLKDLNKDQLEGCIDFLNQSINYLEQMHRKIKENKPPEFNAWAQLKALEKSESPDKAQEQTLSSIILNGLSLNSTQGINFANRMWPKVLGENNIFNLSKIEGFIPTSIGQRILNRIPPNTFLSNESIYNELVLPFGLELGSTLGVNLASVAHYTFNFYIDLLRRSNRAVGEHEITTAYKAAAQAILMAYGNKRNITEKDYINIGLGLAYCYYPNRSGDEKTSTEYIANKISQILPMIGCNDASLINKACGVAAGFIQYSRDVEMGNTSPAASTVQQAASAVRFVKGSKTIQDEVAAIVAGAVVEDQIVKKFENPEHNPDAYLNKMAGIAANVATVINDRYGVNPTLPSTNEIEEALVIAFGEALQSEKLELFDQAKIETVIKETLDNIGFSSYAPNALPSKGSILGNIDELDKYLEVIQNIPGIPGHGKFGDLKLKIGRLRNQLDGLKGENTAKGGAWTATTLEKYLADCMVRFNDIHQTAKELRAEIASDAVLARIKLPPVPKITWPLFGETVVQPSKPTYGFSGGLEVKGRPDGGPRDGRLGT